MAFGKKKARDDDAPADEPGAAPDADEAADDLSGAFASNEEPAGEDDAVIAGVVIDEEGNATAAGASAGDDLVNTDALLNMFQTTQAEADDRSVLLELAGEIDMDDLLEELQTVAAALGVNLSADAA